MPALNIPAQMTAPRPGMVTGRDPARDRGGADFREWMARAATGGGHQAQAAAGESGTAAASRFQKDPADSPALHDAPGDEVGEVSTAGTDGPQEEDVLVETDIPPAAAMAASEAPSPLPGPTHWTLPSAEAPLAPTELRAVSAAEVTEGEGDLATSSSNLAPASQEFATLRASGGAGMSPASLDTGKVAPDPADAGEFPEITAPEAPPHDAPDSTTPEATGTAGTAAPRDAAGQASQAPADPDMPGALAAPLSRDTAAASADQPSTLRLPPLAEPHRQIADAIVRTSSGQVEITLDPVELGRVTVLLGEDGNPGRLALLVERPETLELIRRHSDQLLRDLRENGMPDARLEDLRQDDSANRRDNPRRAPGQPEAESPDRIPPLLAAETARPVALGRLDIRF
ncbi:MAG TPA: flagellar hook-length control protein FliK [Paracoccus solventivorans]|uniref:flagellar hook-length control protein FliK n=1 Tax=Paracoccus solventivorans TaxID=53463 RepID=UPI002CA5A585|nr:flagellar hook-length control protein FliK [Paracoccus solventivorans]HMM08505.1 flagellar hook-length control protein FliK [Paracoccus solventivorans]